MAKNLPIHTAHSCVESTVIQIITHSDCAYTRRLLSIDINSNSLVQLFSNGGGLKNKSFWLTESDRDFWHLTSNLIKLTETTKFNMELSASARLRSKADLKTEGSENNSSQLRADSVPVMLPEITRPLTISMKICGMWHDRHHAPHQIHPINSSTDVNDHQSTRKPPSISRNRSCLDKVIMMYHLMVTILLWFDFFRFFSAVVFKLGFDFNYFVYLCWFFQTSAFNTVLFSRMLSEVQALRIFLSVAVSCGWADTYDGRQLICKYEFRFKMQALQTTSESIGYCWLGISLQRFALFGLLYICRSASSHLRAVDWHTALRNAFRHQCFRRSISQITDDIYLCGLSHSCWAIWRANQELHWALPAGMFGQIRGSGLDSTTSQPALLPDVTIRLRLWNPDRRLLRDEHPVCGGAHVSAVCDSRRNLVRSFCWSLLGWVVLVKRLHCVLVLFRPQWEGQ